MVMRLAGAVLALAAMLGAVASAQAGLLDHKRPAAAAAPKISDADIARIQRALDEGRLLDAAKLLDAAVLAAGDDPRVTLLIGDLALARGQYADALASFKEVEAHDDTRARSLQGQGIALSLMGRRDDAIAMLKRAVAEDPSAWRAWDALAAGYDDRRDWTQAEAAYDHALANSDSAAIVLNNRGFSRLLQARAGDAIADLVQALQKKPDLAAARTNLRLAMAMKGEYDRALAGEAGHDQASLLNNVGFGAMMRGDYPKAEEFFNQAITAKGEYYDRASANLIMARTLEAKPVAAPDAPH
ncbi:MAG TPA: tetratricopeptide repeat protein [Caulobacteraceae bacterium]|jgi:tetratricopeptide (TPR) repeat protein